MRQNYGRLKEESISAKKNKIINVINSIENSFNFALEDFTTSAKFLSKINTLSITPQSIIRSYYALHAKTISGNYNVLQIDTSGTVVHSFPNRKYIGLNLKSVPSIRKTLSQNKSAVSDLYFNIFGEPVISISSPILYRGKLKGAIVNNIPSSFFNSLFLNSFDFEKDVKVYLLDSSNKILFSSVKNYFGQSFFEIPENYVNYYTIFDKIKSAHNKLTEFSFTDQNKEKKWFGVIESLSPKTTNKKWTLFVAVPNKSLLFLIRKFSIRMFLIIGLAILGILFSFLLYLILIRRNAKKLEEKEHKFNVMSQITGQIMFQKEIETENFYWFSNVEAILGYKRDEFNNFTVKQIRELIHPDDRDKVIENEKLILNSPFEFTKIEYRIRKKNGKYIYIEEIETILYDDKGKATQILGTLRDISLNKENEAKILEYQKNLEKLVERRTKALELALTQLKAEIEVRKKKEEELEKSMKKVEAANKLKSEFLAQISHEIRTPINIIVSHISLFKMELGDEVPEDLEYSIQAISKASNRLIRTVELIINAADIHTGSYEPHYNTWDIYNQILRKLFYDFIPQAEAKGLALTMTEPQGETKAYVDEYSVRHIFINLLDNALKYTNKGEISVKIYRNEEDKLIVEISDSGIGINEKYIPNLFEIFSQEHSGYTRKYDGNGLGLTLVKAYCDINNIEIKLNTKKNEGTTFTLIFNGVKNPEA